MPSDTYGGDFETTIQRSLWGVLWGLQFGFEDALVTTTGEGRPAFAGLTVTHATYGKMLTIGADGTVTLYDRSGKGYTEADYNAAQPDGVIPELWNMINGKTDRLNIYV